jgi:hypothetical protein
MKNLMMLLITVGTLSGCTVVKQGELGIVSHWGGSIDDTPASAGFNVTVFDSVTTVDATEVRVPVRGITPKDKDGVLVTTNVIATYRLNQEKAIAFYKQTHEIDVVKQNNTEDRVLGYQVLEQEINNATQKAFSEFLVSDMVPKKPEMEKRLKEILQDKLNLRYPEAFQVNNVNINETKLGDAVESVLQAQAIAKSQRQLLELQKELAAKETEVMAKKMEGIKSVSKQTGIPVERLLEYKLREQHNNVLSEIAKGRASAQVQVQAESGK